MRVACYARFSSDLQRTTSIEDQIAVARQYATTRGWMVLDNHIYTDAGISGASVVGRPGLQALLAAAGRTPPPFEVLLVDDSSRVARDLADAVRVLQQLRFCGVRAIYISQGIDSTSEQAETLVAVHGVVDSLYLRELAKKVKRGLAGQLGRGFSTGSRTFGYRTLPLPDPAGRLGPDGRPGVVGWQIELNAAEAATVVRIFDWYAAGNGVRKIVTELNREAIPGPQGRRWRVGAVRRVLRNERYRGQQVWGQTTYERRPGSQQLVVRRVPREQWVVHERPDLRIVSDDLWRRVQERQREARGALDRQPGSTLMRGRNAALHSRHLFSGFLRCGVCGQAITVVTGGHGSPRYGCQQSWRDGLAVCNNRVTIRTTVADAELLAGLQMELLRPETVHVVADLVAAELNRIIDHRPRLRADLETAHAAAQGKVENLVRAVEGGASSPALFEGLAARERELRQIASDLAGLEEPLDDKLAVIPSWVRQQLTDLATLLRARPERTKAEFRRLGVEFTVTPVRDQARPFLRAVGSGKFAEAAFSQYFQGSISGCLYPQPAR